MSTIVIFTNESLIPIRTATKIATNTARMTPTFTITKGIPRNPAIATARVHRIIDNNPAQYAKIEKRKFTPTFFQVVFSVN